LDYETRSKCDLIASGAYVYARHESTRVLCAAYSIDGAPVKYWAAAGGLGMPADLKRAMLDPKVEMHAWNSQFERLITKHVLGIDVPIERWRCTAAWARASGLPGKLEKALEFIGEEKQLAHKREGHRVMLKWCQPLKDGTWAADPEEYEALIRYCIEDVHSEMRLQAHLEDSPMSEEDIADFWLCERINDRGLPIDRELALAAQAYGEQEKQELNDKLREMTGGTITSASQHARIKTWLRQALGDAAFDRFFMKRYEQHGKHVEKVSTDKAARADFLNSSESKEYPEAVELIEFVDDAGKSSVFKFKVMAARAAQNGRAEGSYLCFGAVQTKRYSSRGVQAHNFPRDVPKDVEGTVQAVLEKAPLERAMHVLSSLLRPAIKAPPGRVLVWGDWSSVEARGMPWLAGAQGKLDLYRNGIDVYRVNAEHIFGTPYGSVPDPQRQIGKVAELSLQFGGAVGALKAMARGYGISLTDQEALEIVCRWRDANKWAPDFSYALQRAYDHVVVTGNARTVGPITYEAIADDYYFCTVVCTLPDGTRLYYPGNERIEPYTRASGDPWSGKVLPRLWATARKLAQPGPHKTVRMLEVMADSSPGETGVSFLKAGAAHFSIERVWHGLLAENVTQAVCAALLRDCLWRVEKALRVGKVNAGIIGHTHDEIILEAATGHAKKASNTLRREMLVVPEWMPGFPLGCELKSGPRYTK
jgi:DNA polymerase